MAKIPLDTFLIISIYFENHIGQAITSTPPLWKLEVLGKRVAKQTGHCKERKTLHLILRKKTEEREKKRKT